MQRPSVVIGLKYVVWNGLEWMRLAAGCRRCWTQTFSSGAFILSVNQNKLMQYFKTSQNYPSS